MKATEFDKVWKEKVLNEPKSPPAPNPAASKTSLPSETFFGNSSYPGDLIDDSGPLKASGYECLKFKNPAQLLALYDPNVREQSITLHPWQKQILFDFEQDPKPTKLKPYKFILVAANGSGKDQYIIAPFAVWFALSKIRSRCIITSASAQQLSSQTETYIRDLCERVNEVMGVDIFRIRQRYIKCLLSGSEIRMFATDEEGKAEGYHPMDPHAEQAIVVSEAKTVEDKIFRALRRCTGYNYWIEVSTPGEPKGHFYKVHKTWKNVKRVTSYDCPHLSLDEIEEDKLELGEHNAYFRSKHLALFTSIDGDSIVTLDQVNTLLEFPPNVNEEDEAIGMDLAAGGDENSITQRKGNHFPKRYHFQERDTVVASQKIDAYLRQLGYTPTNHPPIYADDGGIGRSIIDMLRHMGWSINRILNQAPSVNKKMFGNRGAYNWFKLKRAIETKAIILPDDTKLHEQIYTRKQRERLGKLYLQRKDDAKKEGLPSPDRADSLVLSLCGVSLKDLVKMSSGPTPHITNPNTVSKEELVEWYANNYTYGPGSEKTSRSGKRVINSPNKIEQFNRTRNRYESLKNRSFEYV